MREGLEAMLREQHARAVAEGNSDRASAIAAQLELPGIEHVGAMADASRQIYDVLSRIGHTRRSGTRDALTVPLRRMVTGPHPDPMIRADYVLWSIHVIEEVLLLVGEVLSRFVEPDYFQQQIKPLIDALAAVRAAHPLG